MRRPVKAIPSAKASWVKALAVLVFFLLGATSARAEGTLPAPGEYRVDPASVIGFNVTEFLVNTVHGKFTTFSGTVVVGDSLAASRIEATVSIDSISTGTNMRDEKLKTAEYFDAARFPTMGFVSTKIWGTPNNFGIKGGLTIRGVTKEVVFSGRILDSGVVLAQADINRADFGITAGSTIKNQVELRLQIRLAKPAPGP